MLVLALCPDCSLATRVIDNTAGSASETKQIRQAPPAVPLTMQQHLQVAVLLNRGVLGALLQHLRRSSAASSSGKKAQVLARSANQTQLPLLLQTTQYLRNEPTSTCSEQGS